MIKVSREKKVDLQVGVKWFERSGKRNWLDFCGG